MEPQVDVPPVADFKHGDGCCMEGLLEVRADEAATAKNEHASSRLNCSVMEKKKRKYGRCRWCW